MMLGKTYLCIDKKDVVTLHQRGGVRAGPKHLL